MKTKIYESKLTLNPMHSKTHINFQIDLDTDYDELTLLYRYNPVIETRVSQIKPAIGMAIAKGDIAPGTNVDVLRNLITPSVRLNNQFVGANHSFDQYEIKIGQKSNTPGFYNKAIEAGKLELIFSCHAIVSDEVVLHIELEGEVLEEKRNDKRFFLTELHSHTNHSDADFTVNELLKSANNRALDVLAITDHNTVSAHHKLGKNDLMKIVPGVEYTTFDGHFLCIGNIEKFKDKDFTQITKSNITSFLLELKHSDTLLVMAHPFDDGSPICTGCRYAYDEATYPIFDAIEVWNGEAPNSLSNQRALRFYKTLLNKGFKLVMTCGRDWHRETKQLHVPILNVIAPIEADQISLVQHIKSGHSELQYGYKITDDTSMPYGHEVNIEDYTFPIYRDDALLKIDSNLGYLKYQWKNSKVYIDSGTDFKSLNWVIFEKYFNNQIVAIGNPIFNGGEAVDEERKSHQNQER